jgi:HEAT repeat protein
MENRLNSRSLSLLGAAAMTLMIAGGCGGGGSRNAMGVGPAPSRGAPAIPVQKDVPVDNELAAAARAELARQLVSSLPIARAHAIEGLRYVAGEEAAAQITAGLKDPHQLVRFASAMAIGELKIASAKSELLAHLEDPDGRVRVAVRFALHRIGDYTHSNDLEKTAMDPHPSGWVAGTTALVLGKLGEPSAAKILRKLRLDNRAVVRQQADEALLLLGDDAGRSSMISYLNSGHPDDVMIGLSAFLATRDTRYRIYGQQQLTHEYPEIALVAARAVGAMGGDEGFGVALAAVKSNDARQRALAALAFGEIGRTDAQHLLKRLLVDKDAEVRISAATAILQIAREPKQYDRQGNLVRQ